MTDKAELSQEVEASKADASKDAEGSQGAEASQEGEPSSKVKDPVEEELEDEEDEEEQEWDTKFRRDDDWANPMEHPLRAPWDLAISASDLAKLKTGFHARDMDDKWHILVEDPDLSGRISIHCLRSWTGDSIYVVHLAPNEAGEWTEARCESISWCGDKNGICIDAEQAKKETVLLLRGMLGCEFETLPEYDYSTIFDHPAYSLKSDEDKPDEETKKFEDMDQTTQSLFAHSLGYHRR